MSDNRLRDGSLSRTVREWEAAGRAIARVSSPEQTRLILSQLDALEATFRRPVDTWENEGGAL